MELKSTLKKLFGAEEKALTLTDPEAFTLFGASPTTSGISADPFGPVLVLIMFPFKEYDELKTLA